MCGIFGCSRLTEATARMMPHLAWEMEDRGHDSWGATDGVDIIKRLGPITESWFDEIPKWQEWPSVIFHTRAASTGEVNEENQHPFVAEHNGRTIVGIHNGVVPNHEHLNKKHSRTFDCDSPHIFCALAGMSPTNEIYGYGNLAFYEISERTENIPLLHFLRFNSDNLHIARLKSGEIVFASAYTPIPRAAAMAGAEVDKHYNIESERQYWIQEDAEGLDTLVEAREKTVFGIRHQTYTGDTRVDLAHGSRHRTTVPVAMTADEWHVQNRGGIGYYGRKTSISEVGQKARFANICLRAGCPNQVLTNRSNEAVCPSCMAGFMAEVDSSLIAL